MTLRQEGSIHGRPFAARQEEAGGPAAAFVCLQCLKETRPTPEAFRRHKCTAASASEPVPTPTPEVSDAALQGDRPAGQD